MIHINESVLKDKNISVKEFLLLLLAYYNADIEEVRDSLITKELVLPNLYQENQLVLSEETKKFINKILVESSIPDNKSTNIDYRKLATKIRELFPSVKNGLGKPVRSSIMEIEHKLKVLNLKYEFNFTEDEALKAVKTYVESFNGDYQYMNQLKYFIWVHKQASPGEPIELDSKFMSIIEELRDNPEDSPKSFNRDWGIKSCN